MADGVHRDARLVAGVDFLSAPSPALEALVVPLAPGAFEVGDARGRAVDRVLTTLADELLAGARSARAAATA